MGSYKTGLYFCIFYLIIGFSQLHTYIPGIKYIKPGLLSSILIFALVLPRFRTHEWAKPLGKTMLLFIVTIIPGMFLGYATGRTRSIIITFIQDFVCIFIGFSIFVNSVHSFKTVNTALIITALCVALHVLTHGGQGPGILVDENDVGLVLTMLFPFTYFTINVYEGKFKKMIIICIMLLVLLAIARTLSRGAMVGILPTLFIIWLRSKNKFVTLIVLAAALTVTIVFGPAELLSEFRSIKNTEGDTAGARRYFWELSIEMFKKRPIFGVGAKGWGNAVWSGLIFLPRNVSNSTPHSVYFQLLSELGGIGTIVWFLLVYRTFKVSSFVHQKSTEYMKDYKNIRYANGNKDNGLDIVLNVEQKGECKALLNDPDCTAISGEPLIKEEENEMPVLVTENKFNDMRVIFSINQALLVGIIGGLICGAFLSVLFYSHLYYFFALIQVVYLNMQQCLRQRTNSIKALY